MKLENLKTPFALLPESEKALLVHQMRNGRHVYKGPIKKSTRKKAKKTKALSLLDRIELSEIDSTLEKLLELKKKRSKE